MRRSALQHPVSNFSTSCKLIVFFIDSFVSACLPDLAQKPAAATEADDEAAMLAEFEANFIDLAAWKQ